MTADPSARPRRGAGLLELSIATVLLGVAVAIVVQTASWLSAERRGAERHQRATQEVANLMERLTARPWDELTPELARAQKLSPATAAVLRSGVLDVTIAAEPADPSAKRITIHLVWGDPSTGPAPVRLVAWVHRRDAKEGKP